MKIADLKFLKECVIPTKTTVGSLEDLLDTSKLELTKTLGRIKLTELTRESFADRPEILNKYFRHNNRPLDRFHIPSMTSERYVELVGDPDKLKNPSNAKLETATRYYIDKMRLLDVAKDLGCTVKQLDLSDYIWDDRYYVRYSFLENIAVVDEWYRDNGVDKRYSSTAYDSYIREDPRTALLDEELFDNLYSFCISAIRQRKAMLLGRVDKCLGMLRNVIEYTNGFAENPTRNMMSALKSYQSYFEKLLSDADMKEFLKTHNDITVFGDDIRTRNDYIDTYKTLLKGIISGDDSDLSSVTDLLGTIPDPYICYILEDTFEVALAAWQLDSAQ